MTDFNFIYDLGGGKYAHGRAGERAQRVVQEHENFDYHAGKWVRTYSGVRGRKPIIPVDAVKLLRRDAGRTLCKALSCD